MFQDQNPYSIDSLMTDMATITIDSNRICIICKNTTYEIINDTCHNCHLICHRDCLKKWICYRLNNYGSNVYCPECMNIYDPDVIKRLLTSI